MHSSIRLHPTFLQSFSHSSVGKESTCNARDPSSIPGLGRSPGDRLPTPVFLGFPGGLAGKESACNAGDLGLIPGLGRSLEEGNSWVTHSSILAWRIPWTVYPRGCKESDMTEWLSLHFFKVKSQCPLRAQSKGGWWTRAMTTCIRLNTLALTAATTQVGGNKNSHKTNH